MANYTLNMRVMGRELTVSVDSDIEVSATSWPRCQYCRQKLPANALHRHFISEVTEGAALVAPDTILLEKICRLTNKAMLVGKEPCHLRTCQKKHNNVLNVLWKKLGVEG